VMAIIMHLRLSRRYYHDWTKYVAVAWDCAMVVALCAIAGGPKTSLVLLLFPIVASAALRLSLKLVYFATACGMGAYLILLGMYIWYGVGFHKYYATPELRVPRRDEAIILLSLLVTGLFAGQTVRQMKRLAQRATITIEPTTPEAV
jgi:membrane-bound ClpP family serine protease